MYYSLLFFGIGEGGIIIYLENSDAKFSRLEVKNIFKTLYVSCRTTLLKIRPAQIM